MRRKILLILLSTGLLYPVLAQEKNMEDLKKEIIHSLQIDSALISEAFHYSNTRNTKVKNMIDSLDFSNESMQIVNKLIEQKETCLKKHDILKKSIDSLSEELKKLPQYKTDQLFIDRYNLIVESISRYIQNIYANEKLYDDLAQKWVSLTKQKE